MAMPGVPVAHGSSTSYRCMWVKPPSDRPYHVYSARMVGQHGGRGCGRGQAGGARVDGRPVVMMMTHGGVGWLAGWWVQVGDASVRARVMHHMILHVVERDGPLKPLGQVGRRHAEHHHH